MMSSLELVLGDGWAWRFSLLTSTEAGTLSASLLCWGMWSKCPSLKLLPRVGEFAPPQRTGLDSKQVVWKSTSFPSGCCWELLLSFSQAVKTSFTEEKCTVVPVEKCRAQSSEMTVSVGFGGEEGMCEKEAKIWRHLIRVSRARCWALALECWGGENSLQVAHAAGGNRKHCVCWQSTRESLLSEYCL